MIELKNISKKFGSFALDNINLDVAKGEYFVLLGNSGSGKTMLLESIAGFHTPDKGIININGIDITRKPIQKRNIGFVFHDSALFPHLTVYRNIAYPLVIRHQKKKEIAETVNRLALLTDISHLLNRFPEGLSAGEMQRVALARALTLQPDVLLLDEPLASLDVQLRTGMRQLLRNINRLGQTIMHVTHDYEEAAMLASRIGIIENGKLIQTGCPKEVFQKPRSAFAAQFAGYRNFFSGNITHNDESKFFTSGNIRLAVSDSNVEGDCFVVIRSEDIIISREVVDSSAHNTLNASIQSIEYNREYAEVIADAGLPFHIKISAIFAKTMNLNNGDAIMLHIKASAINCIPL